MNLAHNKTLLSNRRWWALLIAVGALLLMGFYAVTDGSHLANNATLSGADWVGAGICHRLPSHSFTIYGRPLPLCARCTGIYLGIVLSFLVLGLAGRWRRVNMPPTLILLALIGFVGLMGVDGVNSYMHFFPELPHLYEPRNWLRLVTGMGAGLTMGVLVFPALAQTLWRQQDFRPVLTSGRELAGLVLVAITAVLLILSNQPTLLYVLALVSAAGVLLILMAINAVILLILLRRDGRAARWRDTVIPLTIALFLSVAQITAVAWLRLTILGTISGFPRL
ncbi:MAG TPA: DUF2085 domain-containing protein [Anaerolineae bacterium]|nr:DUF2085 domain-containing protein [Anaerolineae bacterium]HIP73734.1 DUF2085 domain-containing protein [Anaerolineae bacterium]